MLVDEGVEGATVDTKVLPHDILLRSDNEYTEGLHNSLVYTNFRRPIIKEEAAVNAMIHLQDAVVPATSPASMTMTIVFPDDQTTRVASVGNCLFVSVCDVQMAILSWLEKQKDGESVDSYRTESWNGLEIEVKPRLWRGLVAGAVGEGSWAMEW